ncbi:nitrate- and nitrite sensing domain-containing protein [Streptomyces sp. RY43-2]|uniref:histidine kinase n=1 Tax=Streptomyces macrolidinus TaxID=2952607 RepID=A0ABT0ZBT0_9ACTN|nr:nitrate- and nitrite sensing domain-containing protein [Streptomyces macrolidinus]MCN9240644.1 nitrate- and nitrite sensing domain-containing protein [Streptomyces macrolidinus]
MRFRGKSIRRKIVALLLVPLLSLTSIWAFATLLTGRAAQSLFTVSRIVEKVGYPTEDTVRVLQQERRQSLVYLADPRASDALVALHRSRAATDEAVAALRENSKDGDLHDDMGEGTSGRLTSILDALDGIGSLRRSIEDGTVDRAQALDLYNRLVAPCFMLLTNLRVLDNVEMDKQGRAIVTVSRARELLSREDALLGSALVAGRLTRDDIHGVSDLAAQRTVLYDVGLPMLPTSESARFEHYWKDAGTAPLRVAERTVIDAAPGAPHGVTAKSWDTAAGQVLARLDKMSAQVDDRYHDRVRPRAVNVIVKAVVAGVLGLVALLVSLILSVRIGRGLIRDLRGLRLEAHEASGVRLPSVMRRLSAGEQIDVETEVPRLTYDKNEIGEVGQALNTLQRAAVEAAVKQAELRAGVSEVFVNLARRSQVLLHKQLTLLDAMERRTEDTDELADLFRLDHLTTRMRRHAEGLVILSGAAPSRQWRKPIQLMDVVRAAVAEVEDYERIEVRRLPRVAVTGSAVADLTHLVAELLENATVFSPPHTAVQVVGERVAKGFTLEIHDRGLGMAAEALLDANLRLAETPEFELSDTDRLGLFVVSRLARRQNVRVSLQPSPYGGTTAVVFIPDALLTDDVPDTNGIGFRLDRAPSGTKAGTGEERTTARSPRPGKRPGAAASFLDGPVELEAPVGQDVLDGFPAALDVDAFDTDPVGDLGGIGEQHSDRGGLLRPRPSLVKVPDEPHRQPRDRRHETARPDGDGDPDAPVPLPRRRTPKLVSSHGRPVKEAEPGVDPGGDGEQGPRERNMTRRREADRSSGRPEEAVEEAEREDSSRPPALPQRRRTPPPADPDRTAPRRIPRTGPADPGPDALPRRVRQASLAPQLKEDPAQRDDEQPRTAPAEGLAERDADEVRSRFASLQRGWRRGREENAAGDDARDDPAPGTTKGDGR